MSLSHSGQVPLPGLETRSNSILWFFSAVILLTPDMMFETSRERRRGRGGRHCTEQAVLCVAPRQYPSETDGNNVLSSPLLDDERGERAEPLRQILVQ